MKVFRLKIDIPKGVQDKYITVLELKLDKHVQLYNGHGGFLINSSLD